MTKPDGNARELRGGIPAEIRADDDGVRVEGYAAVFGEAADIYGEFREVIVPGAFAETLARDDVMFLADHRGLPLARTKSGTLTLAEDARGLKVAATLDAEDPDVKAVAAKMRRGDLDKMSFGFWVEKQEWDETQDPPLRTILQVRLDEVSIVARPAYEGTEIALRSREAARAETKTKNFHAARRRRMGMNLTLRGARENG